MRVIVLGGGGMLGHKMVQRLSGKGRDTWWTVRPSKATLSLPLLRGDHCVDGVDASDWQTLEGILKRVRPDVVVNCVGVIKQRSAATSPIPSITINSLLPHRLADTLGAWGGRLIHFSTDCVFSGRRGGYTEADESDALDLYGRTKFLGETVQGNALTLRTSIIGRELLHHQSLLDWFLLGSQARVKGFSQVWWSGVTTNHLADLVATLIDRSTPLSGVYQVSSGRITKYELLCLIRDAYGLQVEVEPDPGPVNDRSLDGSRFAAAVDYHCPSWPELLAQLLSDPTPYVRVPQRKNR